MAMPDDNVIKFAPRPKKPAPQQSGRPSAVVMVIVAVVVIALVFGITQLFGGFH